MDELDLEIKIDGQLKTDDSTSQLSGIPAEYNPDTTEGVNNRSMQVVFNLPTKLTFFDVTSVTETGEEKLTDASVILRKKSDYAPITSVIEVINGRVVLPENLEISEPILIEIVAAETSMLVVKVNFHGCLKPGKYQEGFCGHFSEK